MSKKANFIFFDGARAFGLVIGVVNVEVVGNVLRGTGAKKLDVEVAEARNCDVLFLGRSR